MASTDIIITTCCASCGKEGGNLNTCNKCKMVKFECSVQKEASIKARKHVAELHDGMMKNYLKIIRLMKKIVQFAFSHCHWIQAKQPSNHVVVNSSARVVFMRCRKHVGEGK